MYVQPELSRLKRLHIALSQSPKSCTNSGSPLRLPLYVKADTHIHIYIHTLTHKSAVISGGSEIQINSWHAFELNLCRFRRGKLQFLYLFILWYDVYFATAIWGLICLSCFFFSWFQHCISDTMFYNRVKTCISAIDSTWNKHKTIYKRCIGNVPCFGCRTLSHMMYNDNVTDTALNSSTPLTSRLSACGSTIQPREHIRWEWCARLWPVIETLY